MARSEAYLDMFVPRNKEYCLRVKDMLYWDHGAGILRVK